MTYFLYHHKLVHTSCIFQTVFFLTEKGVQKKRKKIMPRILEAQPGRKPKKKLGKVKK